MLFRRIVLFALLLGALTGVLLSTVQFWQIIPIIHGAERFEHVRAPQVTEPAREATQAHEKAGHAHPAGAWEPADGAERTAYTLLSNVLTAAGFALVMLAAMVTSLKRNPAAKFDWRYGLLWGAAGYVVFFVAPTLGVLPAIPGAQATPLESRQLWWVLAVVFTAAGLAVAAFGKSPWRWAAALALLVAPHLVAPHLVGTPHPGASAFADYPPDAAAELAELARRFVWATALANAVFWLALGSASVWAVQRFLRKAVHLGIQE